MCRYRVYDAREERQESTGTGRCGEGPDDEIGVFRADKYFNEGLEDGQKPNESTGFTRFAVQGNKEDSVSGPVLNECIEHHFEAWLRLKKRYQDALPKYTTKLLFSAGVKTNVSS
ncbi:hypothetical protein QQ045_014969 [Rhodiola kirilowii]